MSRRRHTPSRASIFRTKATPAPPELLESLRNWHVFSMKGSRQPTETSPTSSESEIDRVVEVARSGETRVALSDALTENRSAQPSKPSSTSTETEHTPVRILKLSKETAKQLAVWLIFSPRGSSQSTGNTPPSSDSANKPSQSSRPEPKS